MVETDPMPHQPPEDARTRTQCFDPAAAQSDPWLGRMAGNYHIISRLGGGGFGTVYTARDVRLDRMVALKMLRYPEDSVSRADLLKEAQVLARLGELPGVVQVYGWGELDENCYFALELLPENAAELLHRATGGLSADAVLDLVLPCAEALARAHDKGIVHGDIKPANILSDGGHGKLCDFGLARFYRQNHAPGSMVVGSPAFMAPEQLQGRPAGPAADIFALGVTLYMLLSGKLPFDGANSEETREAILENRRKPLRDVVADVDPALERIVEACLEPDPAARYPSSSALVNDLRACGKKGKPEKQTRERRRVVLRFVSAFLAVILGAILFPFAETGFQHGPTNTVQAQARDLLEKGEYHAAAEAFQEAMAGGATDDRIRYGLGYALLLDGQLDGAEAVFAAMQDTVRAAEGHAAVAQARNDRNATNELMAAANQDGSCFASVLLASSDLAAGRWTDARDRLASLDDSHLDFDWQRAKRWQALGTAHFRLGELAEARAAFEHVAQSGNARIDDVAAGYLEITRRDLEQTTRKELSAQIARLSEIRDRAPSAETADAWTSRPLRLWVPPVETGNSAIASDSGLADVLPWRLGNALFEQSVRPVEVVDRSITPALLTEQELSAQLSAPEDTVRLGAFLGARVAVLCRANTVFGEETLSLALVDVESSRRIPAGEFSLDRSTALAPLADQMTQAIVSALEKAYPLRGLVNQTPAGPRINIGSETGLKPGMMLRIMAGPGVEYTLPGITATIAEPIGTATAAVILTPEDAVVPAGGWHAEVVPAEDAGNA